MTGKYSVNDLAINTAAAPSSLSQGELDTVLRYHLREDPRVWRNFTEELQTLLVAGLPLEQALVFIVRNSELARARAAAAHIYQGLKQGQSLDHILDEKQPSVIPRVIRAYLIMGVKSGDFGGLLDQAADIFRMRLQLRSDVRAVIWYPSFLVLAGCGIMAVRDIAIAAVSNKDVMVAQERAMQMYVYPLVTMFVTAVVVAAVLRIISGRNWSSWLRLKLPLIGALTRRYNLAMFLDVLATGVASGMQPQKAWTLAARCLNQAYMTSELMKRLRFIEDGESLATAFGGLRFTDRETAAGIDIGEHAGDIPRVLRLQAKRYRDEVRQVFRPLTRAMAPLTLVVVAIGYFIYPPALIWLAFVLFMLWIII